MDDFYNEQDQAQQPSPPEPKGFLQRLLAHLPYMKKPKPTKVKKRINTRFSLFTKTLIVTTLWNFFPSYLFTALSQFTPLCWIFSGPPSPGTTSPPPVLPGFSLKVNGTSTSTAMPMFLRRDGASSPTPTAKPSHIIVNQLFGYSSGLGMGFITFDWAMVAYNSSPLVTPWWAEVNVFATLVVVFWIIAPVMYCESGFTFRLVAN